MDLTDAQWKVLEPLLPKPVVREDGRGRPWRDPRDVLNGVLYILRSGARWKDLPERYPPYQTCHRRFQQWINNGVMEKVLRHLAEDLRDRGGLNLSETYIDGTFAPAKKGAKKSVKPSAARAQRSWQLQTALVFLSPLGLRVLHRMKLDSQRKLTAIALPTKDSNESSEIKPTTVIRWMSAFDPSIEWNSLLLTREIARLSGHKTEEHSGATVDDGK